MATPAPNNWYHIENINELDSPALVVYPQRVKANIALAIDMVGGDTSRLRPHIKTHKSPDVTRLLIDAGIHKFKCATIAEAEMLAMAGAKDVLLAYQPVGPKVQRYINLIKKYPGTKFSCLTDNDTALKSMARAFEAAGLTVPIYLDLNVGMNRTGILPGAEAFDLYSNAAKTPGVQPAGLHAYDGHIRDADFEQKKQKVDEAFAAVTALKQAIKQANLPTPIIIAGGSPSFSVHSKRPEVECSPGTFIYWDKGYSDGCPEQEFQPAALVITRIVSLPSPGRICLDLGHKSIAAENELTRRASFFSTEGWKPIGQSEEHLVIEAPGPHPHKPGDILYGLPYHICPTVNLYERAYTIEDGQWTGEWKNTARDRKLSV